MKKVIVGGALCAVALVFGLCATSGCAGTTVIAPSVEIRKDGTIKIDFEAKITNTTTTSTTAHGEPGETK